ncbi:hypothetical protein FA13DRAFT_1808070 [Coprinellus micaceus]|uniref:Uncharacterized protein n=1 Tax=Coprinellus micaceus TaxID=71717 RepID=A0A4Y7U078_COPMI|nr:hypothetical protein FA13DRAFT_1808070 [Coprinellus micaceus]
MSKEEKDRKVQGLNGLQEDDLSTACFIRHLLDSSEHQLDTSLLLIGFNNAEILDKDGGNKKEHTIRTSKGTLGFVARAVQNNGPMPDPYEGDNFRGSATPTIQQIPPAPKPYADRHPGRLAQFPPTPILKLATFPSQFPDGWRHELDHEVDHDDEVISPYIYDSFAGNAQQRTALLSSPGSFMHSALHPIMSLVADLAIVLEPDRFWLPTEDVRAHPAYLGEAFQRMILRYLINPKSEAVLAIKINHQSSTRGANIESSQPLHYKNISLGF